MMDPVSTGPERTEPAAPTLPHGPPSAAPGARRRRRGDRPSMAAFGGNESCPNCGARMAADQRYCLNCGHRRGDPRLPFMDAVVFMESMNAAAGGAGAAPPPPPAESGGSNRWNANAALIAGRRDAGPGDRRRLPDRSHRPTTTTAAPAPARFRSVQVGGTGGGEAEVPSEVAPTTPGGRRRRNSDHAEKQKRQRKRQRKAGAEEVDSRKDPGEGKVAGKKKKSPKKHPKKSFTPPSRTVEAGSQLGESWKKGAAGCSANGKFESNFLTNETSRLEKIFRDRDAQIAAAARRAAARRSPATAFPASGTVRAGGPPPAKPSPRPRARSSSSTSNGAASSWSPGSPSSSGTSAA